MKTRLSSLLIILNLVACAGVPTKPGNPEVFPPADPAVPMTDMTGGGYYMEPNLLRTNVADVPLVAPTVGVGFGNGEWVMNNNSYRTIPVYGDVSSPGSYRTPQLKAGVAGKGQIHAVHAQVCQKGVWLPLFSSLGFGLSASWEDGGFSKAMAEITKNNPNAVTFFDLKSDTRKFSVLMIYNEECLSVTGKALVLASSK